MISDKISVTNTGEGMTAALDQAAASAAYRGLSGKAALHLRLLAEEMLGMVRQITGETQAEFWIESEGMRFELHLLSRPVITGEMRKELLSVASSGKNAAAVGVMGKLRDIFERAFDASTTGNPAGDVSYFTQGLMYSGTDTIDPMGYALNAALGSGEANWSMKKYKATVAQEKAEDEAAREEWDELEKSIIANIADEVTISIRGGSVEMIAYKKFS